MTRTFPQIALLAACTLLGACDQKGSGGAAPNGSAIPMGSVSSAPGAEGGAAAGMADAGATGKSGGLATAWSGSYSSKQATVPAPRKADDDGSDGVGDGAVTLALAEDRTVKGTLDGPLGESVLYGQSSGETMSGTLFPKQASPTSFYGTWVLEKKDGALKGKIVASRGNATAVREADLTLKGK